MNEPQMKLPGFLAVLGVLAYIGLLGWMDNRDREYNEVIAKQRNQLNAMASECVPMIELDMPIEGVRI